MRTLLGVVLVLVATLGLCLQPAFADPRVLRVRALGDPQTLDWNRASQWMDGLIIHNLMEGLVSVDSKLTPVPALAKSWTISPDNKTYTFHIRKGVKWSDGVALKAQDFVNSWKRLLQPQTQARYASFLFDIEGAEGFHKGEHKDFGQVGVKAVDDHTLQVKLRAAISYWYWIPTFYGTFPVRQDLIEKHPSSWDKAGTMVTVGPFLIANHEPGRRIVLRRNPSYYGKRGNIDEVALALIHDDATALKLYDVGQLDFLPKIAPMEQKRLKGRADFHLWPELRTIYLRFNNAQGPAANLNLRKAIAMGIDRGKLIKVFDNGFTPGTSFVPPGMLSYSKNAGMKFDATKAKAELKASGLDPATLPALDLLTVAFDDHIILAQFIQDELKKNLGLTVRIHILEPKRYYSPLLNHTDYAMQIMLWAADFPDPDNFYSVYLGDSALNRYPWTDAKYDALVTGARSLSNKKARETAYNQAQAILLEQSAIILPLYYGRIGALMRKSVEGFKPGPMHWWMFKNLTMK